MSYNGNASRFTSFCLTNDDPPEPVTSTAPQVHPHATPPYSYATHTITPSYQQPPIQDHSLSTPPSSLLQTLTTSVTTLVGSTGHVNIPSVLQDYGMTNEPQSNKTERSDDAQTALTCCCGRPSCAYWEHNNAALSGLERDLETAARLGQVSYVKSPICLTAKKIRVFVMRQRLFHCGALRSFSTRALLFLHHSLS